MIKPVDIQKSFWSDVHLLLNFTPLVKVKVASRDFYLFIYF